MLVMRSLIFVPANRPNMVQRAHGLAADVIVLDLEDSVPPAEKEAARSGLREAIASLKAAGRQVHVRVNHMETGLTRDDLAAAVCPELDGIVLPKAESGRDARQIDVLIREQEMRNGVQPGTPALLPHVETARGLLRCEEVATASTRISAMSIGGYDYVTDLGIDRTRAGLELDYARNILVHVCIAHGLLPLDAVFGDFRDTEGLAAEAAHVKAMGMKGKYVIHPDQVEAVNRVFQPAEAEVAEARRIIEAFEAAVAQGHASVQLDGRMIDTPVWKRAQDIVTYAEAVQRGQGTSNG